MKKEFWLIIGSVLLSLVIGIGGIRWLAPQLLGMPTDSTIVKLNKEYTAFFDTIFMNPAEKEKNEILINDPITLVRGRPFLPDIVMLGPQDILGFRNHSVPIVAPIIAIGDSQTYGNNVPLELNWPNRMLDALHLPSTSLYSMATGGWGAVQYLNMFALSSRFKPRVIIVAYYTGNDSLETFKAAYAIDKWKSLRIDRSLNLSSLPKVAFPAPESEWWRVQFHDGHTMIFTPRLRYYSNDPTSKVTKSGYAIMEETARIMDEVVKNKGTRLIFTIIPTKEFVYAKRIQQEGIPPPSDYINLIDGEKKYIDEMQERFKKLSNSSYVDIIEPLQQAALTNSSLYPEDKDGHPVEDGYALMGETLSKALFDLPKPPRGIVADMGENNTYQLYLINKEGAWKVTSESILEKNGWDSALTPPEVEARDIALYPQQGLLKDIDPNRFGPLSVGN